jgi:hypothetical protein
LIPLLRAGGLISFFPETMFRIGSGDNRTDEHHRRQPSELTASKQCARSDLGYSVPPDQCHRIFGQNGQLVGEGSGHRFGSGDLTLGISDGIQAARNEHGSQQWSRNTTRDTHNPFIPFSRFSTPQISVDSVTRSSGTVDVASISDLIDGTEPRIESCRILVQ